MVSVERQTEKRAAQKIAPKFLVYFLLEISPFKEFLHDNVKRISISKGSIFFKTVLEEIYYVLLL